MKNGQEACMVLYKSVAEKVSSWQVRQCISPSRIDKIKLVSLVVETTDAKSH
jgi:hypothetical protein